MSHVTKSNRQNDLYDMMYQHSSSAVITAGNINTKNVCYHCMENEQHECVARLSVLLSNLMCIIDTHARVCVCACVFRVPFRRTGIVSYKRKTIICIESITLPLS